MGIAWCGGCDPDITEATVPDNMMGNTGRIHAGVMDWSVSGFPVKRRWYSTEISESAVPIQERKGNARQVVPASGACLMTQFQYQTRN